MSPIHNERIKLTAGWLNGLAGAAAAAGTIAPLGPIYGVPAAPISKSLLLAGAGIWLLVAAVFHLSARYVLQHQKPVSFEAIEQFLDCFAPLTMTSSALFQREAQLWRVSARWTASCQPASKQLRSASAMRGKNCDPQLHDSESAAEPENMPSVSPAR